MSGRACGTGEVSNVRVEGALQRPTSAFRDWIAAGETSPFQPEAGGAAIISTCR
jgi:glutathionyl-hydroquinone reductase